MGRLGDPDLSGGRARTQCAELDAAAEPLRPVGKKHGNRVAFDVFELNSDGVCVGEPYVRNDGSCPKRRSVGAQTVNQKRDDVHTLGLVALAGIARNHPGFTVVVERDGVREELTVLLEHLLREREGFPEQAIEVVLSLRARRIPP